MTSPVRTETTAARPTNPRHADVASAGRSPLVTRLSVWPPLPPAVYARRPRPLPFPFSEPGCRVFTLGRHALWHGVRALGLEPGDEVLVPAYHHGSEVEALVRAGLTCRFFAGSEGLEPVASELETLVRPRTRALVLIHYLGFPQRAARWRLWCDERGLLLIEDAAQAWLAQTDDGPVGFSGDLAVFCLYKTFGVPDGAAVLCRAAPPDETVGPSGSTATARRHVAWLRARIPVGRRPRGPMPAKPPGDDFALGDPETGPSRATRFLLPRLPDGDAAALRRQNYEVLRERLQGRVPTQFAHVPEGAAPFVFPLDTGHKQAVLSTLRAHGIHAFDFWSVPHPSLDPRAFPDVQRLRARIVGLPVHQELRPRDVERIQSVVAGGLSEVSE
jgi:dTDP-4-amino-4,6-dideoxygalactose transaminase